MTPQEQKEIRLQARKQTLSRIKAKAVEPEKSVIVSAAKPYGFTPEELKQKNQKAEAVIEERQEQGIENLDKRFENHYDRKLETFKVNLAADNAKKAKEAKRNNKS